VAVGERRVWSEDVSGLQCFASQTRRAADAIRWAVQRAEFEKTSMGKPFTGFSKFMSYVLRHRPERLGLTLDANGWVNVEELLDAANRAGKSITREQIEFIVAHDEKQRYSFSSDGSRIRANQGHSIAVDLELEAIKPPERLYHGTPVRFIDSIREQGLLRMKRTHVHLSEKEETAIEVGQRRGKSLVIVVEAGKMQADGFEFYRSENGVWLTEKVPIEYLVFPDE
jgi:putative RNA 2'-phosphotransferase